MTLEKRDVSKMALLVLVFSFVLTGMDRRSKEAVDVEIFYSGFDIQRAYPVSELSIDGNSCHLVLDSFDLQNYLKEPDEKENLTYEGRDIALKIIIGNTAYHVDKNRILSSETFNARFLKSKFIQDYGEEISAECDK